MSKEMVDLKKLQEAFEAERPRLIEEVKKLRDEFERLPPDHAREVLEGLVRIRRNKESRLSST